jgi:2-keto-3-deoxy-L-rhamnonate aldolase RhmA
VGSAEAVNERIAQGFQFVALSSDEGFVRSAASSALSKIVKDRKIA